ncbi:hypothetical protein EHI8A_049010 [Entamoeba histolytica HM-1:IMSS-B]|uniref:Uncharacterized protein n=6 Tax=Entamoeba histolytica TaxID=5759 RepID=C4LXZ4_ENTH1|nr:hypothetical protein EHI_035640 [Entamoeba histolytica HM-1:IMSS]EMD44917.1 Hypothetical protein EHI5A_013290 [Entamoeba histolytica KU27]EMH74536.1 hypothetical protein EHI8A_049010 [Entamoeba histolytica HM-1:IMSS-B]EMS16323.1 hypothetical protein KM1_082820 [Entamoeba histolytica HM-3:IMSS]ENY62174.1 hypothetical protein EHI7A_044360 [Entamoeba histolytica HM-1:IMSS-A]GAT93653.1 hypothetical protein CL6EHI_035640 [Entamoeba histolytica]|eukprot:XP_656140.1 hypothetical protein EHI_035640 [Entamoeba histolytica HM-1:IMSS]
MSNEHLIHQLENEIQKLKKRVEEMELVEEFPSAIDAFKYILQVSNNNDNIKVKQLIQLYEKQFNEKDILIANEIKKQLTNKIEEYNEIIKNKEIKGIVLTVISQERKEEQKVIEKVIELFNLNKINEQRKDEILQYFDPCLIELELLKKEIGSYQKGIRNEMPKPIRIISHSPSFENFNSLPTSKSPKINNYGEIAKIIESTFKIHSDTIMILMNTIHMNKMNFLTENYSSLEKITKEGLVNIIKGNENVMIFFFLKRNIIVGIYFNTPLQPDKQIKENDQFLLFIIEDTTITFCHQKREQGTLIRLGKEDNDFNDSWIEIENGFKLYQEKSGTVFTIPKLILSFDEKYMNEFVIQKKSILFPNTKYELNKIAALKWFN